MMTDMCEGAMNAKLLGLQDWWEDVELVVIVDVKGSGVKTKMCFWDRKYL